MSSRFPIAESPPGGPPQSFETLRELTRHGYVPDAGAADDAGGIVLRHASGPDLVLKPDGRLELPPAQPLKRAAAPPPASLGAKARRLSWRRTALFVVFAVAFWIFSLIMTIGLSAD